MPDLIIEQDLAMHDPRASDSINAPEADSTWKETCWDILKVLGFLLLLGPGIVVYTLFCILALTYTFARVILAPATTMIGAIKHWNSLQHTLNKYTLYYQLGPLLAMGASITAMALLFPHQFGSVVHLIANTSIMGQGLILTFLAIAVWTVLAMGRKKAGIQAYETIVATLEGLCPNLHITEQQIESAVENFLWLGGELEQPPMQVNYSFFFPSDCADQQTKAAQYAFFAQLHKMDREGLLDLESREGQANVKALFSAPLPCSLNKQFYDCRTALAETFLDAHAKGQLNDHTRENLLSLFAKSKQELAAYPSILRQLPSHARAIILQNALSEPSPANSQNSRGDVQRPLETKAQIRSRIVELTPLPLSLAQQQEHLSEGKGFPGCRG